MQEVFVEKRFNKEARRVINICNDILEDYEKAGYDLSLRQLYYQLVSRNHVPNTEQSYKRIGSIVSDARLAGLMDWDMIKDRGRTCVENAHWTDPAEILEQDARVFRINLWDNQPLYVEVMVEKQALEGVLEPLCRDLDVPFTANKGYSSSSAMYEAGQRLNKAAYDSSLFSERELHVLYLGDHDPSGIDMTRDIEERLSMFARTEVIVHRVALNMDQIRSLKPPPNPAKMTDARAKEYVRTYGESSWELDAIEPKALTKLVRDAVFMLRDESLWNDAVNKQENMRKELREYAAEYRKKSKPKKSKKRS